MSDIRKRRQFGKCDVTLIAKEDGTRVKAHRSVLIKSSEYFKTMFSSSFKEGTSPEIEMADISGKELKAIIKYAYTRKIDINENNVQKLLPKASLMLYEDIVEKCGSFLISQLTPANCLEIAFLAELYNCKHLFHWAKYYQKLHFAKLIHQKEILELSLEKFHQFLSEHETVDKELEKNVFKCIMKWIEYDSQNRKKFFHKLLATVHLRLIENSFLLKDITNAIGGNEECVKIIKKTIEEAAALKGKNLLIGYNGKIHIYNFEKNAIERTYNLEHLECTDAIIVKNKLIIVSEANGGSNVKSLNLRNGVLTDLPPTLNRLEFCHLAEFNGNLYAIGMGIHSYCIVERFDLSKRTWNFVAILPKEAILCSFAILKNKLFVVFESGEINKMYCYDLETNSWSLCASLLYARKYLSMVSFKNDYLFLFGGWGQYNQSIEKYDLVANKWTKVSQLTNSYRDLTPCLVGNKICVIGVLEKKGIIEFDNVQFVIEEFDPETNKCEVIANLSIKCDKTNYKYWLFFCKTLNLFNL